MLPPREEIDRLRIIHYPDPRLRKPSRPLASFDADAVRALADRMLVLMREARGVGLAAPQVGLLVRIFVMNPGGEQGEDRVFVNPRLTPSGPMQEDEEGCLSIPGVRVQVRRAAECRIEALDLHGNPIAEEATGFVARIWQHETDHLDGRLILDRMGPADRIALKRVIADLDAGRPPTGDLSDPA